MRYCSEDAPRTGERNVNFNKTTSENAVLNKMCKPDERAPSFIFIQYGSSWASALLAFRQGHREGGSEVRQ